MYGPRFTERRRVRIGGEEIIFSTIPAGVFGERALPARGLLETWVLTARGDKIDTHRKYATATWQGSADEIDALIVELQNLSNLVRTNP